LFLFVTNVLFAQDPYIADFYDDKDAAISITFDDGTYGQYKYGFSTLAKHKFVATFSIVSSWTNDVNGIYSEFGNVFYKRLSRPNLYSLLLAGNEIAWHGIEHIAYSDSASLHELDIQLSNEIKFANSLVLPIEINTIFYPYSKTHGNVEQAVLHSKFVFGRTAGDKYNEIVNINYQLLQSFPIYNNTSPDKDEFTDIIDNAEDKWCILMYHHIITNTSKQYNMYQYHNVEDNYSVLPETFDYQMDIISQKDYWVGTIYDIGRYLQQKQNSELLITIEDNNVFVIIECGLNPKIFNHKMTVIYNGNKFNMKPNVKTYVGEKNDN
jgi:hypothetical protein